MTKTIPLTGQGSPVKTTGENSSRGRHSTGRISKQQWLDAALDLLVAGGVEAVRLVELAKSLNISKSGFYWHFESREKLLEEMKQYWINSFSRQIISDTLDSGDPIFEKLLMVVQMIREKQAGKFDLAFASWGARDPSVRSLVDDVRDMRIAFIKSLLEKEGFSGRDLEARARLFVVYFSWAEVTFQKAENRLQGEPLEEILRLISGARSRH
ncbi:MAG: TetR/AcrR family transcriptional regulator [Roseibium sp.]